MGKEIEHKYLVNDTSFLDLASGHSVIKQGYICREKERTVRVRLCDEKAFLTIKGKNQGDTRAEYEYPIPYDDAQILIKTLCIQPVIDKIRYFVDYHGNRWEIDVFRGQLDGLIVAEIEIPASDYTYDIPPFIGKNVTGDPRYYNSNLISGILS